MSDVMLVLTEQFADKLWHELCTYPCVISEQTRDELERDLRQARKQSETSK